MEIFKRTQKVYNVTILCSIGNIILTILKFISGIIGNSNAMIADAVHSLSDLISDIVLIIAMKIANKPEDKTHDYGHGKFETLATLIIGILLILAGTGILFSGFKHIILYSKGEYIAYPLKIAFWAAIVSIIFKEVMFQYTYKNGVKLNSKAMIANAWHHRTDSFSSIGAAIGIGLSLFINRKLYIMDAVASIGIGIFIIYTALHFCKNAFNEFLECSLDEKTENKIIDIIKNINEIKDYHHLRTRQLGNNIVIDIHIKVNSEFNIVKAHNIATNLENILKRRFGENTIISTHIEPYFSFDKT